MVSKIFFKEISEIRGPNYIALQGNFEVYKQKKIITKLKPENRYYPITNNFTTEASIHTNLFRDLYIVLGEGSFDKGIYFQIPHDLFFTNYSTGQVFFGIHPMTRDGGALLVQHHSLYAITGNTTRVDETSTVNPKKAVIQSTKFTGIMTWTVIGK